MLTTFHFLQQQFMNSYAAKLRALGQPACALNIGVLVGLGYLQRSRPDLYPNLLGRDEYKAISERDLHHMFTGAILSAHANTDRSYPYPRSQPLNGLPPSSLIASCAADLTTGLSRFDPDGPPRHWTVDPRFGHFAATRNGSGSVTNRSGSASSDPNRRMIPERIADDVLTAGDSQAAAEVVLGPFKEFVSRMLSVPVTELRDDEPLSAYGLDSISASYVVNWLNTRCCRDVMSVIAIRAASVRVVAEKTAAKILAEART